LIFPAAEMKESIYLLGVTLLIVLTVPSINCAKCTPLPYAKTAPGYCAFTWASGLGAPRAIDIASNGDVLVLDQSSASIIVLWENATGVHKAVLNKGNGLNHAVKINGKFLYASNPTTVFRWPYVGGNRADLGKPEIVIKNVPCCHHTTRTLEFDSTGLLFVQSGSGDNVDRDSTHSQIRRFSITQIPSGGIDWSTGLLYADGLRNEVGLRFNQEGLLWGVENGCDDLARPDLGGDIHQDNPSEEMNLFRTPGQFYGYPYCWSEFKLAMNKSHPTGTQWAHPNFMNDGKHTDDWCQNNANVVPPIYNFGAHMAPLDIYFYYGTTFSTIAKGDAFVSFHGSWDRSPPQGYKVSHVKYQNGLPVSDENFLYYQGPGETGNNWPHRPVGLAITKCADTECLLITSDQSGIIIAIIAGSAEQ